MSTIQKLQKQQLRAQKRLLFLQQELRHQLLLCKEIEENLDQSQHRLLELDQTPEAQHRQTQPALSWIPDPQEQVTTTPS